MSSYLQVVVPLLIPVLLEIVLPLFILFKIYKNYEAIKYYSKFSYYIVATMFVATILHPLFILRPRNVVNLVYASTLLKHVSWLVGIKWDIRGTDLLKKRSACVIVSNHQSAIDILGELFFQPLNEKTLTNAFLFQACLVRK